VDDTKIRQYSRDALATEVAYRRDRRHSIFSWCSSIFVATIGGSAALIRQGKTFTSNQEVLITFTIVVLAVYTAYWINRHWGFERETHEEIDKLETELHMITVAKNKEHWTDWIQIVGIALLALAALATVWSSELPDVVSIIKKWAEQVHWP
jgi:hypothetical protein